MWRRAAARAMALAIAAALPAAIWCQADEINARDVFYSAADLLDQRHPAGYKPPPAKPNKNAVPAKTGQSANVSQVQVAASPLGVRYSILMQNARSAPNEFFETTPDTAFHAGDRLRLSVTANQRGYLYVIEKGSSGEWRPLFPDPQINGGNNAVEPGKTCVIPGGRGEAFEIDAHPGKEKIFILLTRTPETDLDATILSLRKGELRAENDVDRIHKQLQSRDLVFTKVDDDDDKAVYVINKSTAAPGQRVVSDVVLNHQ
jgi:hypothetical protein